jgi:hypothetical protein
MYIVHYGRRKNIESLAVRNGQVQHTQVPGLPIAEWGTPSALVYAPLLGSVGSSVLVVPLTREIRGSCHRLSSTVPEVSLMTLHIWAAASLGSEGWQLRDHLQQLDAKPNHFTLSVVPFDQANCELKAT